MLAPLEVFLSKKNQALASKVEELRATVRGWLGYIPNTFPHYTSHAVDHSDEIIAQVSKLLFHDDDADRPVVELSDVEAYILCLSALLHDAGMVVSDAEKMQILTSPDWSHWVSSDEGQKKWAENEARRGTENDPARNFAADLHVRYMIAEFVRRRHHLRSASLVLYRENELSKFAYGDKALLKVVADVCAAHGLSASELDDKRRFPERCDLLGKKVNVRFVATLLRLGDLLDMRCDRACPLIVSAASPLPDESIAHWTQYGRITHRLTAPDRIEVSAECETHQEHRFLYNWCQWLVSEISHVAPLVGHWERHSGWSLPLAQIDGPSKTIDIAPSSAAKYTPCDWTFEFDKEAVIKLLSVDAYSNPLSFLRELIQNAADASRCQLYSDMSAANLPLPQSPHLAPEDFLKRLPIHVELGEIDVSNERTGQVERRQTISVEDFGTGMSDEILLKYFLQIGRSYYVTQEFKKAYRFAPTSRFGIGFLSCFGVSNEVTVETRNASAAAGTKLLLTGPTNYVLKEKGNRGPRGTRILVVLKEAIDESAVLHYLQRTLTRLEFAVFLRSTNAEYLIEAEDARTFEVEQSADNGESRFAIEAFELSARDIYGELYVFVYRKNGIDRWGSQRWAHGSYREKHPSEEPPKTPPNLVSFHGISLSEGSGGYDFHQGFSARVDNRGAQVSVDISREHRRHFSRDDDPLEQVLQKSWDTALSKHLSLQNRGSIFDEWQYRNELCDAAGSKEFWAHQELLIRVFEDGRPRYCSLEEFLDLGEVTFVNSKMNALYRASNEIVEDATPLIVRDVAGPVVWFGDAYALGDNIRRSIMYAGRVVRVDEGEDHAAHIVWRTKDSSPSLRQGSSNSTSFYIVPISFDSCAAIALFSILDWKAGLIVLNANHPLAGYVSLILEEGPDADASLQRWHVDTFFSGLAPCAEYRGSAVESLKGFMCGLDGLSPRLAEARRALPELTARNFMWSDRP